MPKMNLCFSMLTSRLHRNSTGHSMGEQSRLIRSQTHMKHKMMHAKCNIADKSNVTTDNQETSPYSRWKFWCSLRAPRAGINASWTIELSVVCVWLKCLYLSVIIFLFSLEIVKTFDLLTQSQSKLKLMSFRMWEFNLFATAFATDWWEHFICKIMDITLTQGCYPWSTREECKLFEPWRVKLQASQETINFSFR